jgi:hypothetical protein
MMLCSASNDLCRYGRINFWKIALIRTIFAQTHRNSHCPIFAQPVRIAQQMLCPFEDSKLDGIDRKECHLGGA